MGNANKRKIKGLWKGAYWITFYLSQPQSTFCYLHASYSSTRPIDTTEILLLPQLEKELELLLCCLIRLENTRPAACRSHGAGLLDTSHDHAHMGRLHHYGHSLRLQKILNGLRNLLSETLLDL